MKFKDNDKRPQTQQLQGCYQQQLSSWLVPGKPSTKNSSKARLSTGPTENPEEDPTASASTVEAKVSEQCKRLAAVDRFHKMWRPYCKAQIEARSRPGPKRPSLPPPFPHVIPPSLKNDEWYGLTMGEVCEKMWARVHSLTD